MVQRQKELEQKGLEKYWKDLNKGGIGLREGLEVATATEPPQLRRPLSNDAEKESKSGPVPNKDSIPLHMEKMKQLGFFNGVFEIDLGDSAWDWDEFTVEDMCELIKVRAEEEKKYTEHNIDENKAVNTAYVVKISYRRTDHPSNHSSDGRTYPHIESLRHN